MIKLIFKVLELTVSLTGISSSTLKINLIISRLYSKVILYLVFKGHNWGNRSDK